MIQLAPIHSYSKTLPTPTRFGWSKANPPQNYTLKITRQNVNLETLEPSNDLVAQVAKRLVRRYQTDVPGFAVIPDTRTLLKTHQRAKTFQGNLMAALLTHLQQHYPSAVKRANYSQKPMDYDTAVAITVKEGHSFPGHPDKTLTSPHFDNLRETHLSLLYGPVRNIKGGKPQLTDMLQLKQDTNRRGIDAVLEYRPIKSSVDPAGNDLYAIPDDETETPDYTCTFSHLNLSNYPLVIVSNRVQDGIMHGASEVEQKSKACSAMRRLHSNSILYLSPTER